MRTKSELTQPEGDAIFHQRVPSEAVFQPTIETVAPWRRVAVGGLYSVPGPGRTRKPLLATRPVAGWLCAVAVWRAAIVRAATAVAVRVAAAAEVDRAAAVECATRVLCEEAVLAATEVAVCLAATVVVALAIAVVLAEPVCSAIDVCTAIAFWVGSTLSVAVA